MVMGMLWWNAWMPITSRLEGSTASVRELRLTHLTLDRLEYDGDAQSVTATDCRGRVELTSRTSHDITVDGIRGVFDINQ